MIWWRTLAALMIGLVASASGSTVAHAATSASVAGSPTQSIVREVTPMAASGSTVEGRMESIRRSLDGTHVPDFSAGAYKGKNVIIIQVESLNNFLINKKYGGKTITPNLNSLIGQSWYWPNAYSESGMGNTADAEFVVNSSLYAPYDQACAVKYANRVIPALPRLIRNEGYYSFTMHPNTASYWNRAQLYRALGFNRYYDRAYFGNDKWLGQFGPSDQALFKRGTTVVEGLQKSNTPFYGQFVTLSSHPPFTWLPESSRPVRTPGELSGSIMGKYISAESYTDKQLGQFFKNLKDDGLWDNSIIVIYGDHTAMPSNQLAGKNSVGARKLLGRPYRPIDRQRVGFIIHLPGQTTPIVRDEVAGQVDIMPTVADLIGMDITHVPHVGRSLFMNSNSLVPLTAYFAHGTFLNNRILYVPKSGSTRLAAYLVPDGARTGLIAADKSDLSRANALRKLSDSWVMSLKKFNAGKRGWIPDPVARKAAKKYGFTQH